MSFDDPFENIPLEKLQNERTQPYFEVDSTSNDDSSEKKKLADEKSKISHLAIWASPLFLLIGIIGIYLGINSSFKPPGSIHLKSTEGSIVEIYDKTGTITYSTTGSGMFQVFEDVPAGKYTISVSKEGYGSVHHKRFSIASKQVHEEVIELTPIPPGLMITSIPSGVAVYEGYEYVGTTPIRLDPQEERTLKVRLMKAGYQSIEKSIDWVPGSRMDWNARLQESEGSTLFLQLTTAPNPEKIEFFNVTLDGEQVDYFIHKVSESPTHTVLGILIEDLKSNDYELKFTAENWSSISRTVNPIQTSEESPIILKRKNPEVRIQISAIEPIAGLQDLGVLINGYPTIFRTEDPGINGEMNLVLPEVHFGTENLQIITEEWEAVKLDIKSETQLSETLHVQLERKPRYADLNEELLESLSLGELMIYVDAGNPTAENQLGRRYFTGRDVPKSDEKAFEWFRKSAEMDIVHAQTNLAYMYENGLGVDQNHEEAVKWYLIAAEKGDPIAQSSIATIYYNGRGVSRNLSEAVKWFKASAKQGESSAQINLGFMYENGYGVSRNYSEAKFWYQKAAEQGDKNAREALIRLRHTYN